MFKTGDEITPVSLGGTSYKNLKLEIKNNAVIVSSSFQSYLCTSISAHCGAMVCYRQRLEVMVFSLRPCG